MNIGVNRARLSKPRPKFAAHSSADDRCDQNLGPCQGWQSTVKQFLDDTRHVPISEFRRAFVNREGSCLC